MRHPLVPSSVRRAISAVALLGWLVAPAHPRSSWAQVCSDYQPPYGVSGAFERDLHDKPLIDSGESSPEEIRIAFAPDGTLVIGSSATVTVDGLRQLAPWVRVYGRDGTVLWEQTVYARAAWNTWLRDLIVDEEGNIFIVAKTYKESGGYATGEETGIVARLNPDGSIGWVRNFEETDEADIHVPLAMSLSSDGTFFVTGSSTAHSYPTARYDKDGNRLWFKAFSEPTGRDLTFGRNVMSKPDGGALVVGPDRINDAIRVISWTSDGEVAWTNLFDPPDAYELYPNDAALGSDGSVLIAAQGTRNISHYGSDTNPGQFIVLSYSSEGSLSWAYMSSEADEHAESGFEYAMAVSIEGAADGDVIVSGHRWSEAGADTRHILKRFSAEGELRWTAHFDSGSYRTPLCGKEISHDLKVDSAGNAYAAMTVGGAEGPISIEAGDFLSLIYSPEGTQIGYAYEQVNGSWNTRTRIAVQDNRVAVFGMWVEPVATVHELFRYRTTVETSANSFTNVVDDRVAIQLYPNPTRGALTLKVHLDSADDVAAEIYDVLGRRLVHIPWGMLAPGVHEFPLVLSNIASGQYFSLIHIGGRTTFLAFSVVE